MIRVAVMRHPTPAEWRDVAAGFAPDWLQTEAADFAALDDVAAGQRMPVYRDAPGLDIEGLYREDRALFEAPVSGAGQRADWDAAARLSAATRLVLAGGLDPTTWAMQSSRCARGAWMSAAASNAAAA